MRLFHLLHVIGWDDDGTIEQRLHFSAAASGQAEGGGPYSTGELEGAKNVGGVAAAADAEGNVARLNKIFHLGGKNVGVICVIRPGREHGNVIGHRVGLQAFHLCQGEGTGNVSSFAEIGSQVGGQRGAPSVAESKYSLVGFVGAKKTINGAASFGQGQAVENSFQGFKVSGIIKLGQLVFLFVQEPATPIIKRSRMRAASI